MDFAKVFEGYSLEEVKGIVDAGRSILKERKDEMAEAAKEAAKEARAMKRAEADAAGREAVKNLTEGDEILVTFKGKETSVTFVKVTDKRFTVEVDGAKRSIMFDKFIGRVEETEVTDEEVEDAEKAFEDTE